MGSLSTMLQAQLQRPEMVRSANWLLNAAMDGIAKVTYGGCLGCCRQIGMVTLTALPHAGFCIRCQEDAFCHRGTGNAGSWGFTAGKDCVSTHLCPGRPVRNLTPHPQHSPRAAKFAEESGTARTGRMVMRLAQEIPSTRREFDPGVPYTIGARLSFTNISTKLQLEPDEMTLSDAPLTRQVTCNESTKC